MDKSKENFFLLIICVLAPLLFLLLFNISYVLSLNQVEGVADFRSSAKINTIATLVISAITILSIHRFTSMFRAELREKYLIESMRQFETMMQNTSKQRHDFNNHIQMLYGLLELGQFESARKYMSSVFSLASSYSEILKVNNIEISALLHGKLGLSKSKGIEMDMCVSGDFRHLPIEPMELTSILGNLIDNAIDGSQCVSADKRKITLNMDRTNYSLLISISNHIEEKTQGIKKCLFDKGFSTKGSSGLGLHIVKEIVERHNGRIEYRIDLDTITFTIIIPVIIR